MNAETAGSHPPAAGHDAGPLRVANLCRVLWNGGVARAAIEQTTALRALGVECDLIFLRATVDPAFSLPPGTRVLERPEAPSSRPARVLSRAITRWFAEHRGADASVDLDLLWSVRRELRRYGAVIYNDQYAGLLGMALRLGRGQPYVQMFHEFYPTESRGAGSRRLRPLAEGLDALSILVAPALVTTSSKVADRIERFAPGRTWLARLGAPAPPSVPTPLADRDRRSVFSVTVWDRGRHPEMYLDLARSAPQFRFVLAGIWTDPTHFAEFQSAASSVPNLTVTGPVSEARRVELMSASLLYLRVGYNESGPGMGGLEALAAGSIVLANQGLGISEILTDGVDGFVVDRADPDQVARQLERIDTLDGTTLQRISAAARELAERHSWMAHGRILVEALEHAIRAGPRTRVGSTAAVGAALRAEGGEPPR
jgi:glycosyltransferase involved in cell wall biosynthesis